MGKDQSDYKSVTYEGYGPHGVAVFVDTLTDNTTRTVADVRLKQILSEVLNDQRHLGRCYVKYEVKQGCFHITVR